MRHFQLTLLALVLCFAAKAQIAAISGPSLICAGSTATYTDATAGGTWTTSTSAIITIGATTGIVTGVVSGSATITYTVGASYVVYPVTVAPLPAPITTSRTTICALDTTHLSDATPGGIWSVSNTAVGTIDPVWGFFNGITAGTDVVSYTTTTGCATTVIISVNPVPAPITGAGTVCTGSTITLTDLTAGGIWSSHSPAVASVSSGGVVTGISPGYTIIEYALPTGCLSSTSVTVVSTPAAYTVTGGGPYCSNMMGAVVGLSGSQSGISYQLFLGATAVGAAVAGTGAAISFGAFMPAGTYTAVASGGSSCTASMTGSVTISVNPAPTVYTVTGGGSICAGSGSIIGLSGSQTGVSYQLRVGGVPVGPAYPGTGSALSFGMQSISGYYDVWATDAITMCDTGMIGVTLTILPLPVSYTLTGGGSYCSGGSGVAIILSGSSFGVSYQLYLGGAPVGSPVAGTGSAISFGLMTMAGTYTAVGADMATGCVTAMTGSATVSISPAPTAYTVMGGGSYCAGGSGVSITLSNSDAGASYQLFNGAAAVGSPITGTGSSISFGLQTAAGTYTVEANPGSSCSLTMTGSVTITVDPLPTVYTVTGTGSFCAGGLGVAVGVANSSTGINYELFIGGVSTGTIVSGTGSAISFGLMTISGTYAVIGTDAGTACTSAMSGSATITIDPLPTAFSVTGGGTACSGGTGVAIGVGSSAAGVSYQLYNGTTPVGSAVSGTGAAISLGSVTSAGTYTVIGTDAATTCTNTMTGSATVTTGSATITASGATTCGGVNTLTASGGVSYSWSPSTGLSCATCSSTTIVPAASVIFTVTGTDASGCTGTATAAVDGNSISGYISYSGGSSTDIFQVWLIQFNPSDSSIIATDSVMSCMVGTTTPYYQFMDPAAGSYLVKAELLGTVPGTSGYIPTYSSSTTNWYSAASTSHAASADSLHISMIYGTVPSGPGFISGYVYAGAGKGTTGDAPEPGMTIYLKDATTGTIYTFTKTDATGHYSFGTLAYGTYIIYPESYKYYTTPSDVITISATSTSVSAVNFRKSTTFSTIKPKPTRTVTPKMEQYYIVPNPTSGEVIITWPSVTSGNALVTVTDLTGRTVYSNEFNAATGKADVELNLDNGIYFVAVKTINYNSSTKLMIQK
jgi:hypothetical protein